MADITITIPNNQVQRITTALCKAGGYTGDLSDNAARKQFAKAMLTQYVKDIVRGVERSEAEQTAIAAVNIQDVDVT